MIALYFFPFLYGIFNCLFQQHRTHLDLTLGIHQNRNRLLVRYWITEAEKVKEEQITSCHGSTSNITSVSYKATVPELNAEQALALALKNAKISSSKPFTLGSKGATLVESKASWRYFCS